MTQLTEEDQIKMNLLADYGEYLKNMSLSDLKFLNKYNVFTLAQANYCLNKRRDN